MAYTVHEAKTQFSKLMREAEEGKEVIVMRGKRPVVKIVPISPPQEKNIPFRYIGAFADLAHADDKAFEPMNDAELAEAGFGFMAEGEQDSRNGMK